MVLVSDAALITGNLAAKTGIYALEDVDLVNILCLPRAADLARHEHERGLSAATTYMAARRGFVMVDIPELDRHTRRDADLAVAERHPPQPRTPRCISRARSSPIRQRQPTAEHRPERHHGRPLRTHRRHARRVESARRHRGAAGERPVARLHRSPICRTACSIRSA